MTNVDYLILGAGVSGLSFANGLKSKDNYLIIEKENEAGGYCRTIKRNGFVWDYAGHFFHFSHPDFKKQFEDITQSDETVTKTKNTKIFYKNGYIDYPFQKNIHQLNKEEMIDCLYDLFTKIEKDQYISFLDMLYGKFGRSITEKFLKPYNEKLYACDLNILDVDAMGRFFPYANIGDIIRNMKEANNSSYNNSFLYPKKGASVFVDKLLNGIDNKKLHLSEEVVKIDLDEKIVFTNKSIYKFKYLISSLPLNSFLSMIDTPLETKISFSYNKVLVLNLGFNRDSLDKDIHWLYVPEKDINFYRVGFYNNIIGDNRLSLYIEIGYSKSATIDDSEIENQLNVSLMNLKKTGIITTHKLIDWEPVIMDPAYVHITKDTLKYVNSEKERLKKIGVYIIGRYGEWKYCSIEDCMVDAKDALKSIESLK